MGVVASCFNGIFQCIGATVVCIIKSIADVLECLVTAIVDVLVGLCDCLTCGCCRKKSKVQDETVASKEVDKEADKEASSNKATA
ncbi:hypothetical protein GYMLUDRAFT_48449 [Collybiopsis luxurians FD-317 M1]|uniref:Uncharacterized protein n=1 Tax=Collybiopsis luxurians FD-317 M1 TaxID=944289 RepID=A0A0D0C9R6_9AGAR|nr:hypothetical protein GYMLUDRAFT_48449 [Collybiopsis luxurians FD-317 M1]